MPSEPEPDPPSPHASSATLEGTYLAPAAELLTGVPLPLRRAPPSAAPPRDFGLRLALFTTLLGAVLTILYAQVLARQDGLVPADASGLASYHRILLPLLAITTVAGVLVLERAATLGMVLLLAGTGLAMGGGAGAWLVPGTFFGCVWAVRHHLTARATLGFLLLVPGVAAGYYGLLGSLSFLTQIPVRGLPPGLAAPLSLAQALAPLQLLPVAVLGAWLLLDRAGAS